MNKVEEMLGDVYTPELYEWLESNGFFECPASINHHGNEPGMLWEHSRLVAHELSLLTEKLGLIWQRKESPNVIGLLHDVCKMDNYTKADGKWIYNPEQICEGHGDKSLMMLSAVFKLTEEEMYCIRFHMGAFTDSSQWKYYNSAIRKYPNVLFAHTADMLASQVRGV